MPRWRRTRNSRSAKIFGAIPRFHEVSEGPKMNSPLTQGGTPRFVLRPSARPSSRTCGWITIAS